MRLEPQRDGTAGTQPRAIGVPDVHLFLLLGSDHLAQPVRVQGGPEDQVRACARVHNHTDPDKGLRVHAQRGKDAVVV